MYRFVGLVARHNRLEVVEGVDVVADVDILPLYALWASGGLPCIDMGWVAGWVRKSVQKSHEPRPNPM